MGSIRRKIIYVDDVNFSLVSVKSRLKEHYELYLVQSAARLFEILEYFNPDLILLDINMPGMNGYDTIKKLKADSRYANIPVIFLTGRGDRQSVLEGVSLGAVDYVCKPFSDPELIERIERQFNPDKHKESLKKKTNRPSIIYVDDVNHNLISVKSRLKDYYEVYPFQSVVAMFDMIDFIKPNLILLDINMPGMNGYEAIEKLKTDSRYLDIPVIFLTGKDDKESMIRGFSLGASDYVAKPFSDAELIKRIDNQLNSKNRDYLLQDEESGDKPIILVVDEDFGMLGAVNHALRDEYVGPLREMIQKKFSIYYALRDKYRVYMLSKQDEVKDFLQLREPNLFLLEYKMFASDDLDLVSFIRESPKHKDTPILLLLSGDSANNPGLAMNLGACDFVTKPIVPRDLREKIAKHIRAF
ncbi:MAG: response regulator [Fibromonadales bacterium]|nr:response regulator [Fibromonadales bacterium]